MSQRDPSRPTQEATTRNKILLEDYYSGNYTGEELSKIYKISRQRIYAIISRQKARDSINKQS